MSRLHEHVARRLIEEIVNKEIETGEWLPREVDLAEQYGISRGVAREVVHTLRLSGVIDVKHGRGAWVLPEQDWNLLDPDLLRAASTAPQRGDLLAEVIECRAALEPVAVALAAERASDEQLDELGATFDALTSALRSRRSGAAAETARVTTEVAFHEQLVAGAGNRPLTRMLAPVHVALAGTRYALVAGRLDATRRQHLAIIEAVRARDAEQAREAVTAHARELARWLTRADDDTG